MFKNKFKKKGFCTTTDDVTNLNLVLYRTFVYGDSAPRIPQPLSDDDTVDNFSCRQIGVFPIFSNFEIFLEKTDIARRKILTTDKISKLYLYKLYYYKNFFFYFPMSPT